MSVKYTDIEGNVRHGLPNHPSHNVKLPIDIYMQLSDDYRKIFEIWTTRALLCERCYRKYNDIENIGAWKCRQHAGEWNGDQRGDRYGPYQWDCCGSTYFENPSGVDVSLSGCVPCDHRPTNTPYVAYETDVRLPKILVPFLVGVRRESVLNDVDIEYYMSYTGNRVPQDYTVIRRFNWWEHKSIMERKETSVGETFVFGTWVPKAATSFLGL